MLLIMLFVWKSAPPTYHIQKTIRLHVHMFLRSAKPMCVPGLASMTFQTVVPVVGSVIGGLQQEVRASTRAGWAGFFYCVVPKEGVFCIQLRHAARSRTLRCKQIGS